MTSCAIPRSSTGSIVDAFGNVCTRLLAPAGRLEVSADFLIRDSGLADPIVPDAVQQPVEELPDDVLVVSAREPVLRHTIDFDDIAWQLFGGTKEGGRRVQAICDYVHDRITFDYQNARANPDGLGRHQ